MIYGNLVPTPPLRCPDVALTPTPTYLEVPPTSVPIGHKVAPTLVSGILKVVKTPVPYTFLVY